MNPPGQTEQGVPYHVPSCWVLVGGELGSGNSLAARERMAAAQKRVALFCRLCSKGLFCVFSLSVSLLSAVPLNCPYPNPPASACFFPFSSAPRWGEGRPRGTFVAGRSQTITRGKSPVEHPLFGKGKWEDLKYSVCKDTFSNSDIFFKSSIVRLQIQLQYIKTSLY